MNKKFILGAIVLLVLIVLVGVGVTKGNTSNEGSIPIGGIMILSGEGATWGEASRNGMELAIKEVNARGGVNGKQLRGIYEDDAGDSQKSISAFKKLTTADGAKFIVGLNWSNTGLAVAPVAAAAKVVVISPSLGAPAFNESSEYLFNTWQHDEILSADLADIVYERGHRKVALFGANDVWVTLQTAAFKKRFEQLGGTVAHIYEPILGTSDERTEIQKVLIDKSVDAVVMTTDGTGLTVVTARQLKEFGSTLPLFNITVDKGIITQCGDSCNGMIFPTSLTPTSDFEAKYQAAYNRDVEIGADSAYDAIMMIAEAMEETGSEDPEVVKDYLAKIEVYTGASGTLTSDGKRAFTKPYVLKQVIDGLPITIKN